MVIYPFVYTVIQDNPSPKYWSGNTISKQGQTSDWQIKYIFILDNGSDASDGIEVNVGTTVCGTVALVDRVNPNWTRI